jgi:hypothetical protein
MVEISKEVKSKGTLVTAKEKGIHCALSHRPGLELRGPNADTI